MKRQSVFFAIFFALINIAAIAEGNKKLRYEQAMEGTEPKLFKNMESIYGWADSEHYLIRKSNIIKSQKRQYKVHAVTGEEEIYGDIHELDTEVHGDGDKFLMKSSDGKYALYRRIGDTHNSLYLENTETQAGELLDYDDIEEENPQFSPDGKMIAYTKEGDLYIRDIETYEEMRVTDDGTELLYSGYASWVYYEEILGRGSHYRAFWWSPDSKKLAYLKFDDSPVPEFNLCNSASKYGELEVQRYPKAGDPNPGVWLYSFDLESNTNMEIANNWEDDIYISFPSYLENSDKMIYQIMDRFQSKLMLKYFDFTSDAEDKTLMAVESPNWVRFLTDLHLMNKSDLLIGIKQMGDFQGLFSLSIPDGKENVIFSGAGKLESISYIDEEQEVIYFLSRHENSLEQHLYRINFDGSGLKKITHEPGVHSCMISPGAKYIIDDYSNLNTPAKRIMLDGDGKLIRELDDSKTAEFDEYDLGKTELFTIPIDNNGETLELPAMWVLPLDFSKDKQYPIIFDVYGGPETQSVHNKFLYRRGLLREYYMAQCGIIILKIDHRGSNHFGMRYASDVHRNLGRYEMHDYFKVIDWLKKQGFVDESRIGITGGSYGGYLAAYGLLYGRDYFTHGMSLFPVTDWNLYDNVYTERYMDLPSENEQGYFDANVMNNADSLPGKLYIIHGTMDDNVHMQNSLQLIDHLENENLRFRMMLYPGERHGFGGMKSRHARREEMNFWLEEFFGKGLD